MPHAVDRAVRASERLGATRCRPRQALFVFRFFKKERACMKKYAWTRPLTQNGTARMTQARRSIRPRAANC